MQRLTSRRKLSDAQEDKWTQTPEVLKEKESKIWKCYCKNVITVIIVAASLLILFNFYEYEQISNKSDIDFMSCSDTNMTSKVPTYALYGRNDSLRHVIAVLERLGFHRVDIDSEWDVLWAFEYPFKKLDSKLRNLKPHQKVNHFPGSGYITRKLGLSTSDLPYLPRAFRIPEDKEKLMEYAGSNNNLMFVQKNSGHRGVKIKNVSEIDLTTSDTFVQEYIHNPFLVDGYKFDIGVYTILTSVNPLRVYIYDGDILFRFCTVKYHPFDPQVLDKFICGGDYLPIWQVPSLKKHYHEQGYSMRDSFNAYVESQGKNPNIIWDQIKESIRSTYLQMEGKIRQATSSYRSSTNFFEMVRIDFVVGEDLKVYLMEANMSPNLSSIKFPPNQLLYEQLLFNIFALVGIGQRINSPHLLPRSKAEQDMMVTWKNIVVFPHLCGSSQCQSCDIAECKLCRHCLTPNILNVLKSAYNEHVNRLDCRRVFPPPMTLPLPNITSIEERYSPANQQMTRWFLGKCHHDFSWCT